MWDQQFILRCGKSHLNEEKTQETYKSDIVISYKICTYRLRFRFLQENKIMECV